MRKKEKLPRWLREQRARKLAFFKKIFLFFICFCLLSSVLFLGFKVFGCAQGSLWSGRERLNFVFSKKNVYVISLEPTEKSMVVMKIPEETLIEVTHGYGKYRAGVVHQLGELEKIGGGLLLSETVQEYLGIAIDGFLGKEAIWILGFETEEDFEKKDYAFRKKVSKLKGLTGILQGDWATNFSKLDLFRIWRNASSVRPDRRYFIDLAESYVSYETKLPDGQIAYEVEPERLKQIAKKYFIEKRIREENFLIEVINSTPRPGLGERVARILSNIGVDVVAVTDSDETFDSCLTLTTKGKINSYTTKKIARIFNCEIEESKELSGRSDVVVKIGEDYYKKLNLR